MRRPTIAPGDATGVRRRGPDSADDGWLLREMTKAASVFWAGLLVGVSFLATPVKFQAESLSLPVALDVGRATFHLMSKVEIGLTGVVLVLVGLALSRGQGNRLIVACAVTIALIVIAQAVWLLPELDTRVAARIDGRELESSPLHLIYIVMEIVKLASLLMIAAIATRR